MFLNETTLGFIRTSSHPMNTFLRIIVFVCLTHLSFAKKMEVVFCADFSGSTNGMVLELQRTIWATMNQLEADNSDVEISCGLVGFGRKTFLKENHYSQVVHPLGTAINDIGYSLVKLQVVINSCDAFPQKAMNDCVKKIKWSSDKSVKKLIVFIGNGSIPLKQMETEVKKGLKKDIVIKPVYFKPSANYNNGLESWKKFADFTSNKLIISVPNKLNIQFKKYYDESFISSSGDKLLSTYLPYGDSGRKRLKHLGKIIEKLKATSSDNYEEMLIYQSSKSVQGSNKKWDLVDLAMSGELIVSALDKKALPLFMQSFNDTQIEKYISLKVKERKLVVSKLRLELSKRNEFVVRKQEKSKHFTGKGGLCALILKIIEEEINQSQVLVSQE